MMASLIILALRERLDAMWELRESPAAPAFVAILVTILLLRVVDRWRAWRGAGHGR